MIKIIFLFVLPIILVGCNTAPVDYFGQELPGEVAEIFAEELISKKGRIEHGISFTPDTRELAFGILNEDGINGRIFYSKKISNNWISPENFKLFKGESVFLPYFTPNGESMLYARMEPGSVNGITDIWSIENIDNEWRNPLRIESSLNSSSREACASMANNGTIYFSSNRNCLGNENCYAADLYYSKLEGGKYQSVVEISEFDGLGDNESVFISPKEDYLISCSFSDTISWMDLFISLRDINENWTKPVVLDSVINSKDWDRRPFVTIDNKYLFFTRLQIDNRGLFESDIYWVNTSKLFKPYVYNPFPDNTLKVNSPFKLSIPLDYFKDIDNDELIFRINDDKFDWLEFDSESMHLSGRPITEGEFELICTAIDEFDNITIDTVLLSVLKF